MATVTKARTSYLPTPEEIAAGCDEAQKRRLKKFDVDTAKERARERSRKRREQRRANRLLQQADQAEPVDLEGGPREMSKEDICNVEFINSSDLDSIFDSLIESVSFQHALEDCECRWNAADVDPDQMDLSDPKPFKGKRDVLPFRAKRR